MKTNATLEEAIKQKYKGSRSKLGKMMYSKFPNDHVSEKSFATKIGELYEQRDQTRTNWWHKRPKYKEALCEFLELSEAEIFVSFERQIPFLEFPELESLGDKDDACPIWKTPAHNIPEPPRTLRDIALEHLIHRSGLLWLSIAPGCGKHLTRRMIEILFDQEEIVVSSHQRLADIKISDEKPYLCVIEESGHDLQKDRKKLEHIKQHSQPVVILAPFDEPEARSEMCDVRPALVPNWRMLLLDWIDHRIKRSQRNKNWSDKKKQYIQGLCRKQNASLIKSPGDLIALCASFYGVDDQDIEQDSEDESPYNVAARRWIQKFDSAQKTPERETADDYRKIICRAFKNKDIDWSASSIKEWVNVLKPQELDQKFKQLMDKRLFRKTGTGVSPYPSWVAVGMLCPPDDGAEFDEDSIDFQNVNKWGWMTIDRSRSDLIRELIKEYFSQKKLSRFLDKLNDEPRDSLSSKAAVEAIILMIGDDPEAFNQSCIDKIPWADFFENTDRYGWPAGPDSKIKFPLAWEIMHKNSQGYSAEDSAPDGGAMVERFFKIGWNISKQFECLKFDLPVNYNWLFPFRTKQEKLTCDDFPVKSHWWPTDELFLKLSKELFEKEKIDMDSLLSVEPDALPWTLVPALFISKRFLDRCFEEELTKNKAANLFELLGSGQDERGLLETFLKNNIQEECRKRFAQLCWEMVDLTPYTKSAGVLGKVRVLKENHPDLWEIIRNDLDSEILLKTSDREGIKGSENIDWLKEFSEKQRAILISHWIKNKNNMNDFEAIDLAPFLTREVMDTSPDKLDEAIHSLKNAKMERIAVARKFFRQIWQEDSKKALQYAREWLQNPETREGARYWFFQAPREQIKSLAEVLRELSKSESLPGWVNDWCRVKLSLSGSASESLFELMKLSKEK